MKSNKKSNRIIWGLVALVVLTTLAISFGTMSGHSQRDNSKAQDSRGYEDVTKYPIVDYDAPEPENALEREERKLKNKRYDNKGFVKKNPHPDTGGVSLDDEIPLPPPIPTSESDLIIVGKILDVKAYLSNDKRGIYSEYTVRVEEILKENGSNKVAQVKEITIDRAGGSVMYPNGQKVFYKVSGKNLPLVGSEYVLFLTSNKQSPNYEILTGYELKDGRVNSLDGHRFDNLKGTGKRSFVEAVRNKISESSQPERNQGENNDK